MSMRPSPCTEEKLGASAEISQRYKPDELSVKPRKNTRQLSECSSCEW